MKKPKVLNLLLIYFILLFFIGKSSNTYSATSADTNAVAYFPMHVGNVYVYNYIQNVGGPATYGKRICQILADSILNNHKYYYLYDFPSLGGSGWYRVDSTTGSLLRYDTSNTCSFYYKDKFIDSLSAEPGNQIMLCGIPFTEGSFYKCVSILPVTILNQPTLQKKFDIYASAIPTYTDDDLHYCKGIGITYFYSFYRGILTQQSYTATLAGCVINGVVYGDTTTRFTWMFLNSPDPWTTIITNSVDTSKVVFSWSSTSASSGVKYQWKFKKASGGSYIYLPSDSSGYAKQISIRKSKLDSLANSLGLNGDSVQCAWSCSGTLGTDSSQGDVRVVTIKPNSIGINNISTTIPEEYKLFNNFPNPFNPTTNITFDIPKNSFVKLKIYDVTGKEIISLVNENLNVGRYNYQWDASSFTSGVYFYRLEANDFVETKRMVLLK